jgi:hypothetical protein
MVGVSKNAVIRIYLVKNTKDVVKYTTKII